MVYYKISWYYYTSTIVYQSSTLFYLTTAVVLQWYTIVLHGIPQYTIKCYGTTTRLLQYTTVVPYSTSLLSWYYYGMPVWYTYTIVVLHDIPQHRYRIEIEKVISKYHYIIGIDYDRVMMFGWMTLHRNIFSVFNFYRTTGLCFLPLCPWPVGTRNSATAETQCASAVITPTFKVIQGH